MIVFGMSRRMFPLFESRWALILSAATWICTVLRLPFSLFRVSLPTPSGRNNIFLLHHSFIQWNQPCASASSLIYLAYAFTDLKRAGMINRRWSTIVALGEVWLLLFGPGATFAVGWLWREETLLFSRHKAAIINK
ncbi:hypothetical protein DM02DRAFT_131224 [Periconia macrospinosa]|uniref:Uncharacterized protein n=1 Tax=Periconia macrospinosa TaxID=97972 RepID=A0A2V1DFV8_9PLEO|nr:hypothetical protein DM02DRAFT_131224 [Periconia macrospinosa]